MTQIFSSSSSTLSSEKNTEKSSDRRTFTGVPLSNNKQVQGPNSHVTQRIRSFFRINSGDSKLNKEGKKDEASPAQKTDLKTSIRQSRFIPHIGRNRTNTVASEGNALEDSMSPTANANPYFHHQGPPLLRHHNDSSVPPSPPEHGENHGKVDGASGAHDQQAASKKDELSRKLRRVASAPNAQGLLNDQTAKGSDSHLAVQDGVGQHSNASTLSVVGTASEGGLLNVPSEGIPTPSQIRNNLAFRRTYSSNSIKVRNVEVGPSNFEKVKLIGKGDVGKVYLVKEYKSQRLYAMKGKSIQDAGIWPLPRISLTLSSVEQEGDDQTKQNQARLSRTRNLGHQQPPIYRHLVSFFPILGALVPMHGVL